MRILTEKILRILISMCFLFFLHCDGKEVQTVSVSLKSNNENDIAREALKIIRAGKPTPQLVPLLIDILKRARQSGTKCNVILALKVNKGYASNAVPILIKMLQDKDKRVVYNAIDTLGAIGASPDKVISALLKLNMNDKKIKWHVFGAFGALGASAKKTIPLLMANANDDDTGVRIQARDALTVITGEEVWKSVPNSVAINITQTPPKPAPYSNEYSKISIEMELIRPCSKSPFLFMLRMTKRFFFSRSLSFQRNFL